MKSEDRLGSMLTGLIIVLALFLTMGCDNSSSSTSSVSTGGDEETVSNDFEGLWNGAMTIEGEVRQIDLALDGELKGSYVVTGSIRIETHEPIIGTVSSNTLFFDLPVGDLSAGHPDCINWDISCEGTLSDNSTVLTLDCDGTVCSSGGGQPATWTNILYKQ